MEPTKKYTVITGASSGIGRETAKAFANRGKNLIVAARRTENLEALKREILEQHPTLDVVIRTVDLSVLENVYQFYSSLKDFRLETWINNAGFGNYDSVAQQDLGKIDTMLRLNVEALTILSSLFVRDYKDTPGTQLINLSLLRRLYHRPHGCYLLCDKILCQHVYRGAGLGADRNRRKNAGQGSGSCGNADGVREKGQQRGRIRL